MHKSKIAIFISCVILCMSMLIISAFAGTITIGDADLNGKVEVLDATLVQRYIAGLCDLNDDQLKNGDVDGKDRVNIIDATLIQQYIAQIIDKFPAQEETVNPTQNETINKVSENITIHFSNNRKWATVYAYIYDSATGTPAVQWPGEKMTNATQNAYGETVYALDVDCSKYDRIIFSNGTAQTTDTPLTVANSGYFIQTTSGSKFVVGTYPYGQDLTGKIEYVDLEYSKGYNKRITIWTPVGYDKNDKSKKYSVLYMTDGQNIFGDKSTLSGYEWEVDETILSYMQNGGDGIIVVGVDNSNNKRDNELTPDIGELAPGMNAYGGFENGSGDVYSDFVVEKVIPYVEANYNTNSIRGITGSSSGGIESFYIGMENMDKFDYIGALSPAFLLYEKATWKNYLSKFDFSDPSKLPRIYFFNGNSPSDQLEQQLYPNAVAMQGWLEELGYDSSLMTTVVDNDATHSELFWAVYFPEALSFGLGY